MIKIISIKPAGLAQLNLMFSDGATARWSAADLIARDTELTAPLGDPAYFARAFIEAGALAWPNGLELSPAALHQRLSEAGALKRWQLRQPSYTRSGCACRSLVIPQEEQPFDRLRVNGNRIPLSVADLCSKSTRHRIVPAPGSFMVGKSCDPARAQTEPVRPERPPAAPQPSSNGAVSLCGVWLQARSSPRSVRACRELWRGLLD